MGQCRGELSKAVRMLRICDLIEEAEKLIDPGEDDTPIHCLSEVLNGLWRVFHAVYMEELRTIREEKSCM